MTDTPEQERRQSQRRYQHGRAQVLRIDDREVDLYVQVMNISEGGVRIVSDEPAEEGSTMSILVGKTEHNCQVHECRKLYSGYVIRTEYLS